MRMSILFEFKGFVFDVLNESSKSKFGNQAVGSEEMCYCLRAEKTNFIQSPDFSHTDDFTCDPKEDLLKH